MKGSKNNPDLNKYSMTVFFAAQPRAGCLGRYQTKEINFGLLGASCSDALYLSPHLSIAKPSTST